MPIRHRVVGGGAQTPGVAAPAYRPGSEADFDRLYRDSYHHLLHTMLAVVRDRAIAEDCVQEAFVKAYRAWPRWKPDAPAEAWLHRIALNVAASRHRHERLREVGELVRRLGRPDDRIEDPTGEGDLYVALRRLPARDAAILVLRHHHGYSNREIATAMGAPESTIASRLAVAKRRLARRLAEDRAAAERGPSRAFDGPVR
ncbi:MAG: hypothetical protein NVS3B18_05870 [Candidatus Dormibacteria bacterium]